MKKIFIVALSLIIAGSAFAKKENKDTLPVPDGVEKVEGPNNKPYYVMLPDNFDPKKTYWLYVLVHGYGGNGHSVT